jgi:hypothetical protein
MQQEFSYQHYDPDRLLDTLQQRLGITDDHELAQHLHISCKTLVKSAAGICS